MGGFRPMSARRAQDAHREAVAVEGYSKEETL